MTWYRSRLTWRRDHRDRPVWRLPLYRAAPPEGGRSIRLPRAESLATDSDKGGRDASRPARIEPGYSTFVVMLSDPIVVTPSTSRNAFVRLVPGGSAMFRSVTS